MRWLWLMLLVPAWMLQYMMVVPTVWSWRYIVVPSMKLGVFGVVMICIPFIGWIILAVVLLRRPSGVRKSSAYRMPWGVNLLKES